MSYSLKDQFSQLRSVEPRSSWKHATRDFIVLEAHRSPLKEATKGPSVTQLLAQLLIQLPNSIVTQLHSYSVTRRIVLIPLSIIVVVVLGIGVSANSALSSVPGDALYPIKLVTENVRLSLTWKETERAKLKTEFAKRRLDEVKVLSKQSTVSKENIKVALDDFKNKVESAKQDLVEVKEQGSAAEVVEVAKVLDATVQESDKKLSEVKQELPKEVKAELKEAVQAAQKIVDDASTQSLTALVEQATKDGATTKEEVKTILQDHLNAIKEKEVESPSKEVEVPGGSSTSADQKNLPPTTYSLQPKIAAAKQALASDNLTEALDAVKETKELTRAAEAIADDELLTNSTTDENGSLFSGGNETSSNSNNSGDSTSSNQTNQKINLPPTSYTLQPNTDDHTNVDKQTTSHPEAAEGSNVPAIIIEEK